MSVFASRRTALGVFGTVLVVVALWALRWRGEPSGAVDLADLVARDDVIEDALPPALPFLGPSACAPCHQGRVAEFEATRHARACRVPTADIMPAGFHKDGVVYQTRFPEFTIEISRDHDAFFQTVVRKTTQGQQRTKSEIALVYGSGGKADEVYFTWRQDALYELPLAWLHPLNDWGESPFSRHLGPAFSRVTTPRCLECHNTWFDHQAGTTNVYRREHAILGVTCERCHGPGAQHVAFHQANPDSTAARDIVQPGRLTRERQLDVCAQCHSNAAKHREAPFSYRPGERLDDYFRTASNPNREDDRVADQVKYLRQSKCFTKSDSLTCTSCHDPHRPDKAAAVRQACLTCHERHDCDDRERLPAAVRDDCVGCHMPRFTRIQVHFHTPGDRYVPVMRPAEHRIGVYPEAKLEVLLNWRRAQTDAASRKEAAQLTEALVEHWRRQAERYQDEHRSLAAIGALRESLRLERSPETQARLRSLTADQNEFDSTWDDALHAIEERRFQDAVAKLQRVLKLNPSFAKAHSRLGTVHAITGERELAAKHLKAAAADDPDDPYAFNMLGWLAYLDGRGQTAIEAFRQAEAIEPYSAEINYRWGLAALSIGRAAEAGERFRRAVKIDPKLAGAYQGLSHALRQQGENEAAIAPAARAARLTELENADILVSLGDAYAGAARWREAITSITKAIAVAEKSDPKMIGSLRARLGELQRRAEE